MTAAVLLPPDIGARDRLIGKAELRAILNNRSNASIDRDVAAGRIPRPIRLGPGTRRVFWRLGEVTDLLARLKEREPQEAA